MKKEVQKDFYTKTVKVCGMDRQELEEKIQDLLSTQEHLTFTFTSLSGEIDIQISAKTEKEEDKRSVKEVIRELKIRLGSCIFTTSSKVTLEETIVELLKEQKMTVTTVESCTGGMLSARLTDVAGASLVFKSGFVTYSNKAKRKFIGVKKMTLKKHTAVSEQTAYEMARGGAVLTGADTCVSVTGYAGPDSGEEEQPVGLVYIGCSVKGKVEVEKFYFKGDRKAIREQAVVSALTLLRSCILKNYRM
ncbi:MAG: nicotinamide-nucleotide amidohydrolase family protein [Lachnospiraceae bacterium]|jgi:nicotinamide-nucleotide amidase|nr:nicotinamide-nucleotide amidohydrolase family protein [Lachnospiraceae bacterium]